MRVLIITTSYPAHDEDPSGHFVRAEARLLARAGHEVHVLAPLETRSSPTDQDPRTSSLFVHRLGGSELFGWPGAIARVKTNPLLLAHALPFAVAARQRLKDLGHFDRAIGQWIVPSGFPLLFDHPADLEVVAHGADVRLLCALPKALRHAVVKTLLDREARFRFVARASLQTLSEQLPSSLETRLIAASHVEPAAIELPDVATRAEEIRAAQGDSREFVVAVGRLIELKRFDLALGAAASVGVPIVVVGEGPLRADLERFARKTGAQATFTGLLSRTETLAWIAAARALVHPSRAEAAPTVVREARALGIPVIATTSGDVATWAETDPGIVLVDALREAFAAAIVAVIAGE